MTPETPPASLTAERVALEKCHDSQAECPNCGGQGLEIFYQLARIPVHSCLLVDQRTAALEFPTHDLRLGYCRRCGFITNTVFDPTVHNYSQQYEETQGFSPTFSRFARSLAQRLVEQHHLRGKTVLEIGCGKGEFLVLLCELGAARGIGIDPSYIPERTRSQAAARIEFIRDFYGPQYAHLTADFVCCRHTLEHIAPTGEFVRALRASLDGRPETVVFFELPETLRILREGAFWDIYYEHCSYFTPGSLARLFRAAGFDVSALELAYDDQYILLTATPAPQPTAARLELEDDLQATHQALADFARRCGERLARWRSYLSQAADEGRRVVLWGSGSKAVAFLTTLGVRDEIEYVVDINPHKHGCYLPVSGQRIVGPEFLREYRPDAVIVMNPIYCDEIGAMLGELGLRVELLSVND